MEKVKFPPFIIAALIISSVIMALYAYQNFRTEETAYGIVFVLLCVFLLALTILGIVRNRRVSGDKTYKS